MQEFKKLSEDEVRSLVPEIFEQMPDADWTHPLAYRTAQYREQGVDPMYMIDGRLQFVSPMLAQQRGLSGDQIHAIKEYHLERADIFKQMEGTDDVDTLKAFARKIEDIEYALQSLWTFDLNPGFHEWFRVPKCTCPKMDNAERRSVPTTQIITLSCPIHGDGEYEPGVGWR